VNQQISPQLQTSLEHAGDQDKVDAVVMLGAREPRGASTESQTAQQDLLQRVSAEVGEEPTKVRHFPLLNTMAVCASGAYLRRLLASPEVTSAVDPAEFSITVE